MRYIHQTYALEGTEETRGHEKAPNLLTGNGLEALQKYGRICGKIFSDAEFLILQGLF